jgi:hypothetical protein
VVKCTDAGVAALEDQSDQIDRRDAAHVAWSGCDGERAMGCKEQLSEPQADAFRILGPEVQSAPRPPPRPERAPSAAAACSAAIAVSGGTMSALAGIWQLCPPLSGSLLARFCVCMQASGWGAAAARRGLVDAQLLNMATATRLLDGYSSPLMISTPFSYVAHSCCLWGHKCITFFFQVCASHHALAHVSACWAKCPPAPTLQGGHGKTVGSALWECYACSKWVLHA